MINGVICYSGKSFQKLAKSVSVAMKDVAGTTSYYKGNLKEGWAQGLRLAKKQDLGAFDTFCTKATGAARKIKKTKLRKEDLPAVCAGIGTFTPVPLGSVLGYGIGKLLQFLKR